MPDTRPRVVIAMGSESDWPVMKEAAEMLERFGVPWRARVLSAHRTPSAMQAFAERAASDGVSVIVAGAGGAAHLPGMIAASTRLPVIGVPIPSKHLQGLDSLLSIVQMPKGVPVATVAVGAGANAGILAAQILAVSDADLAARLDDYKREMIAAVEDMDRRVGLDRRP